MAKKPKKNQTTPLPSRTQRDAALNAIPFHRPVIREKEEDGKLYVTVEFERARWQQFLGADQMCERTFALDEYGRKVYEGCDGKRQVRHIIHNFAKATNVSKPEAETAVTRFMRTMMIKGLITMQMEKPQS